MVLLHALIAIAGLAVTTFAYFRPSKASLRSAYGLAVSTLVTGTYLVIVSPSHLMEACVAGLVYFAFVGFGIIAAHKKLAVVRITNE
ncbi:MAG TPA: hypothetical protein VLA88_03080 [Candidatus Saccharimonadales bacterium]|nr:hypothetical protein [Candidatus Saccharimonadales bacterium]